MVKRSGQIGWTRDEVVSGLLRYHSRYAAAPLSGEAYQDKIKADKTSRLYNLPNYRQVLNHFKTLVEGWRAAGVKPDYPTCKECGNVREVYKVRSDLCKKCGNREYRSSRKKSALQEWQITDQIRIRLESAFLEAGDKNSIRVALNWLSEDSGIPVWALTSECERLKLYEMSIVEKWSEDESSIVREFINSSADHIQRELKRLGYTRGILAIRRYRHALRRNATNPAYSVRELARLLGVGRQKVTLWIGLGWLLMPGDVHRVDAGRVTIHLREVLNFILHFRSEFCLSKVDQEWFKSVVLENLVVGIERDEGERASVVGPSMQPCASDKSAPGSRKGRANKEIVAGL